MSGTQPIWGDPDAQTCDLPLSEQPPVVRRKPLPRAPVSGRFLLGELIGRGGHAQVYDALDTTNNNAPVAIKVLRGNERDSRRLLREAHLLLRARHPHIVKVIHVEEESVIGPYFVMERLVGHTLEELLERTPIQARDLPFLKRCCSHLINCLEALHTVHEMGGVHRDLKPENIFLHEDLATGEVMAKVLDFGVACDLELEKLTATGQLVGTVAYMAPEQLEGEPVDRRTDIHGIGAILYDILTGEPPHGSQYPLDAGLTRLEGDGVTILSPHKKNPTAPTKLCEVCLRALAKNPQDRPDNGMALARLIEAALRESVPTALLTGNKKKPSSKFIALGLALAAVTASIAVYWVGTDIPAFDPGQAADLRWDMTTAFAMTSKPAWPTSWDLSHDARSVGIGSKHGAQNRAEPMAEPAEPPVLDTAAFAAAMAQGAQALDLANFDRAEAAFERALALWPRSPQAQFGLGRVAYEKGAHAEAVEKMSKALAQQDRPSWRLSLGLAAWLAGDLELAKQQWEKVVRDNKDEAAVRRATALLATHGVSP